MPKKRKFSSTNIYHVIYRGNNKKVIFLDDQDNMVYIHILKDVNKKHNFLIYAFCLMRNHVHLLLDMKNESISLVMKKINYRYSIYFKNKYHTIGRLYQCRFRSECIENDDYLTAVLIIFITIRLRLSLQNLRNCINGAVHLKQNDYKFTA